MVTRAIKHPLPPDAPDATDVTRNVGVGEKILETLGPRGGSGGDGTAEKQQDVPSAVRSRSIPQRMNVELFEGGKFVRPFVARHTAGCPKETSPPGRGNGIGPLTG